MLALQEGITLLLSFGKALREPHPGCPHAEVLGINVNPFDPHLFDLMESLDLLCLNPSLQVLSNSRSQAQHRPPEYYPILFSFSGFSRS